MPHAQMIFDSLFRILTSEKSYENEYVMRTVMRLSSSLHDGVLPYLSQLMEKLVLILRRSSRVKFSFRFDLFRSFSFLIVHFQNPNKPNFSHYLFETITVLIRSSVTQNPTILAQFEQVLFPVFTPIFTDDVAGRTMLIFIGNILLNFRLEFVPYVLQIIGFLLESHPTGGTTLPDAYRSLFQSILTPAFWDRSGNIPALSRLVQAYIEKAGETIVLEKIVRFHVFSKLNFIFILDDRFGNFSTSHLTIKSS